jgi:hypothetical protein
MLTTYKIIASYADPSNICSAPKTEANHASYGGYHINSGPSRQDQGGRVLLVGRRRIQFDRSLESPIAERG